MGGVNVSPIAFILLDLISRPSYLLCYCSRNIYTSATDHIEEGAREIFAKREGGWENRAKGRKDSAKEGSDQ
jgi:hypothetical protein